MKRLHRAALLAWPLALGWTSEASAHAFAQRYDLPLPLWYYLAGAGAAVALSFVAAAAVLNPRRARVFEQRIDVGRSPLWRALAAPSFAGAIGVVSVALFLVLLGAGFLGPQGEPESNLLVVTVWVLWWVGLTYVCALAGDAWRTINPLAILARWASALWMRAAGHAPRPLLALPERVGIWPACILFLAFAWAELVWPQNAVPPKLACAMVGYALVSWAGMAVFGIETWLRRGEALSVFFALIGRFAPLDPQAAQLRHYGAGLIARGPLSPSETAFVVVVLATVSFDGIKETPLWNEIAARAAGLLYASGMLGAIGNVAGEALVKSVGLLAMPLAFGLLYLGICRIGAALLGAEAGRSWSAATFARLFVLSLVPIAIGYHLAHYLSYLLIHGQAAIALASDPFGLGWNLFGTRGFEPDIAIIGARFVWSACVIAIVLGHVAAVLVAHVIALHAFGDRRLVLRSQYPMLALMVAYTMLSLWILSQPIVKS